VAEVLDDLHFFFSMTLSTLEQCLTVSKFHFTGEFSLLSSRSHEFFRRHGMDFFSPR